MKNKIKDNLSLKYNNTHTPYIAQIILTNNQSRILYLLIILLILLLFTNLFFKNFIFIDEFTFVITIFFIVLMNMPIIHRFVPIIKQFNPENVYIKTEIATSFDLENLPNYSILAPLYKEKELILKIIYHLSNIKYPKNKLQILLLLEIDDIETKAMLPDNLPENFSIIEVPLGFPRGKPRALNYGLKEVNGEFLTIYDAEDIPDPYQLLKAISIFDKYGDEVWAIQAKLRFNNPSSSWLSLFFYCEYRFWYDIYLPYLFHNKYPIPLGGTSNHLRTEKIKTIIGWDSYNVTEDADLSLRIYYEGGKVVLMDSITHERAPTSIANWIRQRSRWVKGLIQTMLVHTRKKQNSITIRYFLYCISGTLLPFYILILFCLSCCSLSSKYAYFIFMIQIFAFLFNIILTTIIFFSELVKTKIVNIWAFLFPGVLTYWIIYLIASIRAAYQLFTCPFYWDKTNHNKNS